MCGQTGYLPVSRYGDKMKEMELKKLRDFPELSSQAARWFSLKWGIPEEAYQESILECIATGHGLEHKVGVPQWYIVSNAAGEIIAGAGIIENDFHDRKDLSPNLCALFVEETYRRQGIAKRLLDVARTDLGKMGYERLYLVTDHTRFYERCGWDFLTMVQDEEGSLMRMYQAPTLG